MWFCKQKSKTSVLFSWNNVMGEIKNNNNWRFKKQQLGIRGFHFGSREGDCFRWGVIFEDVDLELRRVHPYRVYRLYRV